jgi:hypothetical protein
MMRMWQRLRRLEHRWVRWSDHYLTCGGRHLSRPATLRWALRAGSDPLKPICVYACCSPLVAVGEPDAATACESSA